MTSVDFAIKLLGEKKKYIHYMNTIFRQEINTIEDYFSEFLYKILKRKTDYKFKSEIQFDNFVKRSLRNMTIDDFRKNKVNIEFYEDLSGYERCENIVKGKNYGDIRSLINKLSPRYKEYLILRFGLKLKYREIAELLGKPIGTVKAGTSRGIKVLNKKL